MKSWVKNALTTLVISIVILMISSAGSSAAGVGIDLQYWYSDENIGHIWTVSEIPTYILYNPNVPLLNLSLSNLHTYVNTAYSRWSPALKGKTWRPGPSPPPGPAPMALFSCMQVEPKTRYELGVPDSFDGITIVPNSSDQFITHGYYGTRVIDIYKIVGPIYVHPIYNSKSGSYSVAKWKIIMTHEMGHAFGYWGHYSSGAVMKASGVTTTYPNTNEIRHLKQLN